MSENDQRREQILDAAAAVIIRLGYNKATMGDIAEEAGASRRTVYLYFKGKEELFEALLYREYMHYSQAFLEQMEADPRGGTVGGSYRALFKAVSSRPLMAAIMRRDRRVIGNYLRKTENLFAGMSSGWDSADFYRALQAAGALRKDIDAAVIAHVIEIISYGQLMMEDFKPRERFPPDDEVAEALADMMDRALLPKEGGSSRRSKAIFRQVTEAARARLERSKRAREATQTTRQGAANDD